MLVQELSSRGFAWLCVLPVSDNHCLDLLSSCPSPYNCSSREHSNIVSTFELVIVIVMQVIAAETEMVGHQSHVKKGISQACLAQLPERCSACWCS